MCLCVRVPMRVCICVCACMYVCACVCMCMCVCACVHVCVPVSLVAIYTSAPHPGLSHSSCCIILYILIACSVASLAVWLSGPAENISIYFFPLKNIGGRILRGCSVETITWYIKNKTVTMLAARLVSHAIVQTNLPALIYHGLINRQAHLSNHQCID